MPVDEITIGTYNQFIKDLRNNDAMNDTTLYTYGRDLKPIFFYFL